MREVIVWGGTGQAHVLNECLLDTNAEIVAVLDSTSVGPPFRSKASRCRAPQA
jgi:hypothetical protein